MVILRAFIESDVCAKWIDVWRGNTLRQLDTVTFNYFKSFYGVENMALYHVFDNFVPDYEEEFFYGEFFEDDF